MDGGGRERMEMNQRKEGHEPRCDRVGVRPRRRYSARNPSKEIRIRVGVVRFREESDGS